MDLLCVGTSSISDILSLLRQSTHHLPPFRKADHGQIVFHCARQINVLSIYLSMTETSPCMLETVRHCTAYQRGWTLKETSCRKSSILQKHPAGTSCRSILQKHRAREFLGLHLHIFMSSQWPKHWMPHSQGQLSGSRRSCCTRRSSKDYKSTADMVRDRPTWAGLG